MLVLLAQFIVPLPKQRLSGQKRVMTLPPTLIMRPAQNKKHAQASAMPRGKRTAPANYCVRAQTAPVQHWESQETRYYSTARRNNGVRHDQFCVTCLSKTANQSHCDTFETLTAALITR